MADSRIMAGGSAGAEPPPLHGGNVHDAARRLGVDPSEILDFSSNCNAAVHGLTADIVRSVPVQFDCYPDPDCTVFREALAHHEGVSPAQCLAGNGSAELIHLAVSALRPRAAVVVGPTFVEYSRALAGCATPFATLALSPDADFTLTEPDLDRLSAMIRELDADMVFLCSPNNPTGAFHDPARVLERMHPGRTLVLDTAYRHFLSLPDHCGHTLVETALQSRPDTAASPCRNAAAPCGHAATVQRSGHNGVPPSRNPADQLRFDRLARWAPQGVRVLTIGSPTKFFHCPGMRLGWCVSDETTITTLRARQPPWMVSGHAQEVGVRLLEQEKAFRDASLDLHERKAVLADSLAGLAMVKKVFPGSANFLLLAIDQAFPVINLRAELLQKRIMIRDCATIPGLETANMLRVQVLDEASNAVLVEAMRALASG